MSGNLLDLYTTQFTANLEMKLQQKTSKLRGRVSEGSYVGKMASPVNQIGAIAMAAPAGRFAPKVRTDATFTRRWVFPQDKEMDQYIDSFDKLRTIVDPQSAELQSAAAAAARCWDDALITAAFADASTGQDAAALSTEQFDSAYSIANDYKASATTGLTVAKMIEAKRIMRHNHVDLEEDPITLVIGSTQEADLLSQVQVVSTDFNDKPVLVEGRDVRFLGFDIVVSERLSVVSSDRKCIAFAKSGLHLGIWKDMTNNITKRNDLSGEPWDLYTAITYGATRTQPGKVIRILCNDAVGADITP